MYRMNAKSIYRRSRKHGSPAAAAWKYAKRLERLAERWEWSEDMGLVRIEAKPDEYADIEDLSGDMFDVDTHADTVPGGERTIKAQYKTWLSRIERDGVWGVVGEYRDPELGWTHADSCWGFEGYMGDVTDPEVNDYALDIMEATIEALRDAIADRCPRCKRLGRPAA